MNKKKILTFLFFFIFILIILLILVLIFNNKRKSKLEYGKVPTIKISLKNTDIKEINHGEKNTKMWNYKLDYNSYVNKLKNNLKDSFLEFDSEINDNGG